MERFKLVVAVHLFLVKDNKILLLRRYNTGYEDGNYSVIAGHLDGNEFFIDGMIREAKEEAGIEIKKDDLKVVGLMYRLSADERIDFFLEASVWSGEITNIEKEKCDDLSWFSLDELPSNIVGYVSQAIENYRKNKIFSGYGW